MKSGQKWDNCFFKKANGIISKCGSSIEANDTLRTQLLINKVKSGDVNAIGGLLSYCNWVANYVHLRLGSYEDAEEVIQNVFFRIQHYIHKYDPDKGSFKAWVSTIARNEIYTRRQILKKCEEQQTLLVNMGDVLKHLDKDSPECIFMKKGFVKVYEEMLNHIPNKLHRQVFELHMEGYTYTEISNMIKCTPGSAKNWCFRCRKQLKKILKELGYDYDKGF